jgi:hypothetical protein
VLTLDWLGTVAAVAALGVMLGAAWWAWSRHDEFPDARKREQALRRMGAWDEQMLLPPSTGNVKIKREEQDDE